MDGTNGPVTWVNAHAGRPPTMLRNRSAETYLAQFVACVDELERLPGGELERLHDRAMLFMAIELGARLRQLPVSSAFSAQARASVDRFVGLVLDSPAARNLPLASETFFTVLQGAGAGRAPELTAWLRDLMVRWLDANTDAVAVGALLGLRSLGEPRAIRAMGRFASSEDPLPAPTSARALGRELRRSRLIETEPTGTGDVSDVAVVEPAYESPELESQRSQGLCQPGCGGRQARP